MNLRLNMYMNSFRIRNYLNKLNNKNIDKIFSNIVLKIVILSSISHHRLTAMEFSSDNPQHISQLKQMGIHIQSLPDGRKY